MEERSWKVIRIIIYLIMGCVISISMTSLMAMSVSLSYIQKIYLCAYFFVVFMGMVLYILKNASRRLNLKNVVLIGIISCTVIFLCKDKIVPYEDEDIVVTATGQKNNAAVSYEAWILEIEENGVLIDASKVDVGSEGWCQQGNCLLSNEGEKSASIVLHFDKMENLKITMLKHPWSGVVDILFRGMNERVDLYSEVYDGERTTFEFSGMKKHFTACEFTVLYGGLILALYIVLLFFYSLLYRDANDGWIQIIINLLLFLAVNYGELNGFLKQHTQIIMLLIIMASVHTFEAMKTDKEMAVYFLKESKILLVLLDFYMTFAIVGHYLFISTNKVTITLEKIIAFIVCAVIFYPVVLFIVYIMKKTKGLCTEKTERTRKMVRKLWICNFFIMLVPLVFFSLGYYPANMTSDGVDQWAQALGITPIYNSHPAIHTIFLRLCSKIAVTPYSVVIVQILCFSLIWTRLFAYLYKKGLDKKVVYIISVFLACTPNNFIMLSLVSKNIIYAVIILWVTYILIRLIDNPNTFFSVWKMIEFSVALALLYTVRHNGYLAVYAISAILCVFAIRHWRDLRGKPALVVIITFGLVHFIQGPLYDYYGVPGNEGTIESRTEEKITIGPLINPIGTYIWAEEELPEQVRVYKERIGTEEEWRNGFNPYNGDVFGWGLLLTRKEEASISFKEAFDNYIEMMIDKPLLVIKDRLTAIDILWNVIEPSKSYAMSNAYNARYVVGLWPPAWPWIVEEMPELLKSEMSNMDGSCYFKPNQITNLNIKIVNMSAYQFMDSILWRVGIYVILGLFLIVIYIIERNTAKIIVLFPVVITSMSLALAFSCQIYQYYWFVFLAVIFNILYYIGPEKANEFQKKKEISVV